MLYIPRRHRRKLLLPPGLLALAFLLLVGCGVIAPIVKERTKAVHQAAFPPSRSSANNNWPTTQQLVNRRQWESFEITGNKLFDWLNWQQAQQRIKESVNNLDTLKGTRIYFHQESKYRYIITALDYMHRVSVERYTFDLRSTVPTLYVLDGKKPVSKAKQMGKFMFICGTPDQMSFYSEPLPSLEKSFDKVMRQNELQIDDFASWFIAGLAIVIMTIRKLTASTFS